MHMCSTSDAMNKSKSKHPRMLQVMQVSEVVAHDDEEVEVEHEVEVVVQVHVDP